MGQETGIAWCDHTHNFWRGCVKIAPECQRCYAEQLSKRNPKNLGYWGLNGPRVVAPATYFFDNAAKYDRDAKKAGERRRVFTNSLADFCEDYTGPIRNNQGTVQTRTLDKIREQAAGVMAKTMSLDWLVLTKRPHRLGQCLPSLPNIWAGTSVGTSESARNFLPHLVAAPHLTKFVSVEPLLESIDLEPWLRTREIDWVIIGCESNGKSVGRLLTIPTPGRSVADWLTAACRIVEQCDRYGVKVFVKQIPLPLPTGELYIEHDVDKYPSDLQRREWPKAKV